MIDPQKYADSATDEHAVQVAIFAWAALNRPTYPELKYMFSVPNGFFSTKAQKAKMKAAGLRSGVPDFMLLVKRGEYSGLIVELKLPKYKNAKDGGCSPEQIEYLKFFKVQGFGCAVAYGYEEAIENIKSYLEYRGK